MRSWLSVEGGRGGFQANRACGDRLFETGALLIVVGQCQVDQRGGVVFAGDGLPTLLIGAAAK